MLQSRGQRVRVVVAAVALCWGALASAESSLGLEDTVRASSPAALGAGHRSQSGDAPTPGLRPQVHAVGLETLTSSGGGGTAAASAAVAASLKIKRTMLDTGILRGDRRLADPSPTSAAPPADDIDDLLFGFDNCPASVDCCLEAGKLVEREADAFYEVIASVPNRDWPAQACTAKGWVAGATLNLTVVANRARLASAETKLTLNLQANTLAYAHGETQGITITKTPADSTSTWGGTFEQPTGKCNPSVCCCPNQLQLTPHFVNGTMMGFSVASQLENTALSKCKSQFSVWGAMVGDSFHGIGDASKFAISQEGNQATFSTSDDRCTFGMVHTKNAQGGDFGGSDDMVAIVAGSVAGGVGGLGLIGAAVWATNKRRNPITAENSDDGTVKLNSPIAKAHEPSTDDDLGTKHHKDFEHAPASEQI